MTNDISLLGAQIDNLEAEIARYQAHYDGSYEDVLAAEQAGDVEATARHDEWLEVFDSILTSLRANHYAACAHHNALLAESDPTETSAVVARVAEETPEPAQVPCSGRYTLAQARYILSHVYCVLCVPEDSDAGYSRPWFPGLCLGECIKCVSHCGPDLRVWIASEAAAKAWLVAENAVA